jgi:chaperonin cofactor prefoldin
MELKNNSPGARIVNRDTGRKNQAGDKVGEQVLVMPGQVLKDFTPVNPDDPVFVGMCEDGQLVVDGKNASKSSNAEAELAKRREELDKQAYELQKQANELARQREELKHLRNPMDVTNREAAMIAGTMVADPLPPGTDTKGGKESEEALRRAGIDPKEAQGANPATGGADKAHLDHKAQDAQGQQAKDAAASKQPQHPQPPKK